MQVTVNGEIRNLNKGTTVLQVLEQLGWQPAYVAVAIDRCFLSRSHWSDRRLQEGEEVEVVAPMQGG